MFGNLKSKMANDLVGKTLKEVELLEGEDSAVMMLKSQGNDIRVITCTLVKAEVADSPTLAIGRIVSNLSVSDALK